MLYIAMFEMLEHHQIQFQFILFDPKSKLNHISYPTLLFLSLIIIIIYKKIIRMYISNKHFPTQGLVISQSRPILIDTDQKYHQTKPLTSVTTISKLPAFQPDDKITKILYSKFLVKGVKPINSDIMLTKLKGVYQKKGESKSKKNKSPHLRKQRIVTDLNTSHNKLKNDKQTQRQKGIFQFTVDQHDKFQKRGRPQTAFQRSHSLKQINRPLSAAIHHSNSQKRLTRPTSVQRSVAKNRSITAISRTNSAKNHLNHRFQMIEQNENMRPIMTITDDYSNLKNINYVQKNRREASIKKQNTYITDVQIDGQNNIMKLHQKQGYSTQNKIVHSSNKSKQRQTVTPRQKLKIKQKNIDYLNYLKDNEPQQYAQCVNYLMSLDQNGNKLEKSIFSISFDQSDDFLPSNKEVQEEQVKDFYQNFYNICIDVQYGIKKAQRKVKTPEKSSNLLNIYQCEQLLELYKQIQQNKKNNSDYRVKTQRIQHIIKGLSFFCDLKPQIVKNMLDLNFKIELIKEDEQIIKEDSDIKSVNIILNGSVSKKNKQQDDLIDFNKNKVPEFFTTLFDGQVFGLPSKPQQKTLKYTIRTLQKCLLMMFPYEQYRKALSSNQNIEDRIQLLKDFLPIGEGNFKLGKEDYEIIAFQMQSNNFSAQEIIYREGQHCQKLILIASGKAAVCLQSILSRKRLEVDPIKKTRNQIMTNKHKIKDFRRKNLKNYEVLQENAEHVTYYYSQILQQKIRGDVLNLQGFYNKMLPVYIEDSDFVHVLTYSLISLHDNTKIYQLAPQKTETFPQHIKNALSEKAQSQRNKNNYKRNSKEINKWENFKQQLVHSILNQKGKK